MNPSPGPARGNPQRAHSKREALFGYRLRFAPETQPIRQTVVDNIVLRSIQDLGESAATIGKVGRLAIGSGQEVVLPLADTRSALHRLHGRGFVDSQPVKRKDHWRLTAKGQEHLAEGERYASSVRQRVSNTLFGTGASAGREADFFFDVLAYIFDEITTAYLDAMFSKSQSPVTPALIKAAIGNIATAYQDVDQSVLSTAAVRFFGESSPEFDWIKWTYCKNFYSVRAIGLGSGADVLSASLFEGATFYLDTNLIIAGLDQASQQFLAARQVLSGLARIKCRIAVLQITLFELRDYATRTGDNLTRVLEQIPDALLSKVRGPVARAEKARRLNNSGPSPEDILAVYEHAESAIAGKLGGDVVEDDWFDAKQEAPEIGQLAANLKRHYLESTQRQKTDAAALHDALALAYLEQRHGPGNEAAYFLTLDLSLPKYKPVVLFEGLQVNRAITLDSLMPWMGAVSEDDEQVSKALSAVLANQLMLSGGFSLLEFRMLAELDMDCGKMPAEDVEQCMLFLRREARDINLSKAEDRERLHALVKGFFSSPDRKYLAELIQLNAKLESSEVRLEEERKLRRTEEAERRKLEDELKQSRLRARVIWRLGFSTALFLTLELVVVVIADKYSAGTNLVQKVGSMWWLVAVVASGCVVFARWLCRGELWGSAKHIFDRLKGP